MTEFYFSVGLTDQIDYEGFVYDTMNDIDTVAANTTMVNYNVRKASTEIEKQSIRWKLNTDIPAISNVILTWETIIRRPHLNMVGIRTEPSTLSPDYTSYNLSIDYINLIPIDPAFVSKFQSEDYAVLTEELEFGDLSLNSFYNHQFQGVDWRHSLIRAYQQDDLSDLWPITAEPVALPRFQANFQLKQYSHMHTYGISTRFNKWAEDNRQELTAKGYIPGTDTCKVGSLPLGKLVGDPWEEYQKLQAYPRVCRTSITKTE